MMYYFSEIKRLYRSFITGVKNLYQWFNIIWNDRDWDYHFILKILEHKLRLQANKIGSRNLHEGAKANARDMIICANLINKLKDDYYRDEYIDFIDTKILFIPIGDGEKYKMDRKVLRDDLDFYYLKYKNIHKRVLNGEKPLGESSYDERIWTAMNIAEINTNRAYDLLFKILKERLEYWWD